MTTLSENDLKRVESYIQELERENKQLKDAYEKLYSMIERRQEFISAKQIRKKQPRRQEDKVIPQYTRYGTPIVRNDDDVIIVGDNLKSPLKKYDDTQPIPSKSSSSPQLMVLIATGDYKQSYKMSPKRRVRPNQTTIDQLWIHTQEQRVEGFYCILPNLYLTSKKYVNDANLQKLKITHVVTLLKTTLPQLEQNKFHRLHIQISDNTSMEQILNPATQWIHDALQQSSNNRVLVHCRLALSRSPTIIIAYLMRYIGLSYQNALSLLYNKKYPEYDGKNRQIMLTPEQILVYFDKISEVYQRELKEYDQILDGMNPPNLRPQKRLNYRV
jgi:protein-tyrosine phosphatase